MTTSSYSAGTVRLHRVLRAPADRLYRAFIDPKAMVKWLPPKLVAEFRLGLGGTDTAR